MKRLFYLSGVLFFVVSSIALTRYLLSHPNPGTDTQDPPISKAPQQQTSDDLIRPSRDDTLPDQTPQSSEVLTIDTWIDKICLDVVMVFIDDFVELTIGYAWLQQTQLDNIRRANVTYKTLDTEMQTTMRARFRDTLLAAAKSFRETIAETPNMEMGSTDQSRNIALELATEARISTLQTEFKRVIDEYGIAIKTHSPTGVQVVAH